MGIFPNFRGENKQYLSCHHLEQHYNLQFSQFFQQNGASGDSSVRCSCTKDGFCSNLGSKGPLSDTHLKDL